MAAISTPASLLNVGTPTATATPPAPARAALPGEQVYSFDANNNVTKVPNPTNVPPAPKTPTPAPTPSPTYSFLNGATYTGSGKQIAPPTVVTAKPAITDLANKQSALDQVLQAQNQQNQNIATQQANLQPAVPPTATPTTQNQNQPQGTSTTNPPAAGDLSNVNGAGANQANQAILGIQNQADAAFQNFQSQIQQIMSGSFPLTPSQQAQVNATQASFNALKTQQDLINRNFEGQIRVAAASSGLNMTAPQVELGQIKNAMDSGVAQISAIDTQASKAIADLQQGFMTQDYDLINASYSAASKLFSDKTQAIQDMNTNVQNATNQALEMHKQAVAEQQQAFDNQQTELKNQQAAIAFAAQNGISKPFYLVGNTAIDTQTGKPVSLSEYQAATGQQVGLPSNQTDFSQIQHIVDPSVSALQNKYPDAGILPTDSVDQATAKLNNSRLYLKETYIPPSPYASGGSGGTIASTDANGNPINIPLAVAPYYNQSHNGVGWVDTSTLQGTAAQKKQIIDQAQAAGLKVVTNKNSAADLTNINDAYSKLDTIGTVMADLAQPGWIQRDLYGLGFTKFAEMAQSDPQKAAAGTLNSVGLDMLKAISGVQGFRGNQSAIEQVKQELPSIYDTQDTVKAKIANISKLIADRENAITGSPTPSQVPAGN
ncbi:MAG: hypothetical protein ACREGC_00900, partial [Minisyncoccia bacterium]